MAKCEKYVEAVIATQLDLEVEVTRFTLDYKIQALGQQKLSLAAIKQQLYVIEKGLKNLEERFACAKEGLSAQYDQLVKSSKALSRAEKAFAEEATPKKDDKAKYEAVEQAKKIFKEYVDTALQPLRKNIDRIKEKITGLEQRGHSQNHYGFLSRSRLPEPEQAHALETNFTAT